MRSRTLVAAGFITSMFAGPALADSPMFREQMLDYRDDGERIELSLNGAYEHQFRASIDGAGRVAMHRANVALAGIAPITADLDLAFNASYALDYYRFSNGPTALGDLENPWDDIHTINFGATFNLALDQDWTLFGGPVFQFAGESGASASDMFSGGGIVGLEWRLDPNLVLGGGVGITSTIKDDVRIYPVVKVDWRITNELRIAARTHHTVSGDIGAEIIYNRGEGWEAAFGATYRHRRFRLDEDGPTDHGIGQERYLPLYGRFTYEFTPDLRASIYGGVVIEGDLKLEDSGGNRISRQDYDPAGIIGVNINVRF